MSAPSVFRKPKVLMAELPDCYNMVYKVIECI